MIVEYRRKELLDVEGDPEVRNQLGERIKEWYYVERQQKCAINQAKAMGNLVSITLWLMGKLQV